MHASDIIMHVHPSLKKLDATTAEAARGPGGAAPPVAPESMLRGPRWREASSPWNPAGLNTDGGGEGVAMGSKAASPPRPWPRATSV